MGSEDQASIGCNQRTARFRALHENIASTEGSRAVARKEFNFDNSTRFYTLNVCRTFYDEPLPEHVPREGRVPGQDRRAGAARLCGLRRLCRGGIPSASRGRVEGESGRVGEEKGGYGDDAALRRHAHCPHLHRQRSHGMRGNFFSVLDISSWTWALC